jgi:hypothetical protein
LIEAGSYGEAIETLDDLISDDDAYLFGLRGRAFLAQGLDVSSAIRDFTRAIKLEESKPDSSDPEWSRTQKQCLSYLYDLRSEAHEKNGAYQKARLDSETSHQLDTVAC